MIRTLPFLIELALVVFCIIDVIQTPESDIRNLPKWAWIILILIVPLIGSIAWLVAGRPVRPGSDQWRPGAGFPEQQRLAPSTADIDARLDDDLARLDREHEESLRRWQAELERRESQLPSPGEGDETNERNQTDL
ncbi:MAG: PLDc N-terminal domain-containing protein [Actinomycetes bacterium]